MTTALVVALVALVVAWAVWTALRRSRQGSACCGEHEQAVRRVGGGRSKGSARYELTLGIGGMTCDNCARKVENALNGLTGLHARVRVDEKCAHVSCEAEPDEATVRAAVRDAGYVVMSWKLSTL